MWQDLFLLSHPLSLIIDKMLLYEVKVTFEVLENWNVHETISKSS